jgi:hypothetical protein
MGTGNILSVTLQKKKTGKQLFALRVIQPKGHHSPSTIDLRDERKSWY